MTNRSEENEAVYTATPVAGGWAGAVMSWAGALTSMIYSYLHFSTFKQLKNAKKAKCDRTDRPTDTVTYRSRCPRQKTKDPEMSKL